jgi:hypothetical protein
VLQSRYGAPDTTLWLSKHEQLLHAVSLPFALASQGVRLQMPRVRHDNYSYRVAIQLRTGAVV